MTPPSEPLQDGTVTCSLCAHVVPRRHLHQHQTEENRAVVEYTINLIKSRHPEWSADDPSCQKCWDFYRQL